MKLLAILMLMSIFSCVSEKKEEKTESKMKVLMITPLPTTGNSQVYACVYFAKDQVLVCDDLKNIIDKLPEDVLPKPKHHTIPL